MTDLQRKAFEGLTFFLGALLMMLLLPAWTLAYYQAWIYWIIWAVAVVAITLYFLNHDPELIRRRIAAGPAAEKEKSQKIIQSITSVLFIALMVLPGIDYRNGWSHMPFLLVVLGYILIILGFLVIFLVFKENSFTSAVIETDKNQRVISSGPYKIVRHPMYAGALLLFAGTALALNSYWTFIIAFLLTLMLAVRLLVEEKFLLKELKGYKEYCKKVRFHLIPYIW